MLVEMRITDLALVGSAKITFGSGLNILTGETGSGKTIIVDCLNLVLGGKTDRSFVRTGAEKGLVQATFDVSNNRAGRCVLEELGIEAEGDYIEITREIHRNGRSVSRVCGIMVTLSDLKRLAGTLMDIHGQHEHQALLNQSKHIEFLDSYGDAEHAGKLATVSDIYAKCAATKREIESLQHNDAEKERMTDILKFQITEIKEGKLRPGEEDALNAKLLILENAEKVHSALEQTYRWVYEADGKNNSAQIALKKAARAMQQIAGLDNAYQSIFDRIESLFYAAQDIGYEVQGLLDLQNMDPEEIDKINLRLQEIDRLERKYGATEEEVLHFAEEAQRKLDRLDTANERLDLLKKAFNEQRTELIDACKNLSESRVQIASKLSTAIMKELKDLAMKHTLLSVLITPLEKPQKNGMDSVAFMISPNPGEPLKPLREIASGGELSRIMLALKNVMMDIDDIDSMVFDEIDTGISGRTAQTVGEKMYAISKRHQVLCITHLPQIAALADEQFLVRKEVRGNQTETYVEKLDHGGRIEEIARLVGGTTGTAEESRKYAAEMLQQAEKWKATTQEQQENG